MWEGEVIADIVCTTILSFWKSCIDLNVGDATLRIFMFPTKYASASMFTFSPLTCWKKNVTLGWHVIPRSNVSIKTRAQVKLHLENKHRSRPLFLDWGMIELFKQCSHREHVPTLHNMMLMYVVQNYKEWEPSEIPQHLVVDLDKLKYTVRRFTHIWIIIVLPVFRSTFFLGKHFGSSLQRISWSKHEDRDVSNISYWRWDHMENGHVLSNQKWYTTCQMVNW